VIEVHPGWPQTLTPWQRLAEGGYAPEVDTLLDIIDEQAAALATIREALDEVASREEADRISDSEAAPFAAAVARMADATGTPFPNGAGWPDWEARNCQRCAKSAWQVGVSNQCEVEKAVDWSFGPGAKPLPAALARRAGLPGGTVCPERQEV
jgi:hypothetical protein